MSLSVAVISLLLAQAPAQPRVQPGPNEPDWDVLLTKRYATKMFDDLENPVVTRPEVVPGLFRKAGEGRVTYRPVIALGLEVPIHGGFYAKSDGKEVELWSYQHKSTTADVEKGGDLSPPLKPGSEITFDPGDKPFGLWVGNDQFRDRVATEPSKVKAENKRLTAQPYKAMIYRLRDAKTGRVVPNSYLIGWEYSTNDDFQDVVCIVENVTLIKD